MSLFVDIHKRLGDFRLDAAFSTEEGPTGLIGASGSGKSLTLRLIAGVVKPDAGRIVLNGRVLFDSRRRIDLPPQRRHVGYLFQNYALFPNMSVEQNVACGLCHVRDRRARDRAVHEMLEAMRLTGLSKHRPHQLSGGQQQRAALARILVGSPEILLLDEPTSALDGHLAEQVRAELAAVLQRFGKDALLVTHARDEAAELCRSLAVMENGRIVRTGETGTVFSDPASRYTAALTGCRNIVDARKAGSTSVAVPDWGVIFETGRPVPDDICAVGVHANRFSGAVTENRFPVRVSAVRETPFARHVLFRYESQIGDAAPVLCSVPKTDAPDAMCSAIGVRQRDILLLTS